MKKFIKVIIIILILLVVLFLGWNIYQKLIPKYIDNIEYSIKIVCHYSSAGGLGYHIDNYLINNNKVYKVEEYHRYDFSKSKEESAEKVYYYVSSRKISKKRINEILNLETNIFEAFDGDSYVIIHPDGKEILRKGSIDLGF